MILVDTSVWIELLAGKRGVSLREDDLPDLVTCGPVVQEVLQGLWPGPASDAFRDPIPLALFLSAADIYRQGRRRGLTIRSSVDCLIAAIAIENRVPVWHWDRDFTAIARYTTLETV
jgi:hypothetical protein